MRNSLSGAVIVVWVSALLLVLFLGAGFFSLSANSPTSSPTIREPTGTPVPPSSTPLPPPATATSTPSPTATRTPRFSPTPSAADLLIIGTSAAGRPLEVYQFGSGERERLIIAGIHGGYEWNTIELAEALIDYLNNQPGIIPENQTLFILKALNPDGYARSTGLSGRANENGVDLNRNFPSNWQSAWPTEGCWSYLPISGGSQSASEPETAALMAFVNEKEIDSLINYHSAALGIFAGGQPPDPASLDLAESVAAVSTYPFPPLETGCEYTGQLIDWASDQGIAAVDIELTNHQVIDFEQNLRILSVFLDWEPPE